MLFATVVALVLLTITAAIWLLSQDRGASEPLVALWIAFGFGLIALGLAVFLERPLLRFLGGGASISLALALMSVAVVEEWAKFWPLAAYIYRKPYFNEHTDGIIYFGLSGLAFGLVENLGYTALYGASTGLARIVLIPLFHVATTATVGYYLASAKLDRISFWKVIWAWIAVVLLHAAYDFCLYSGIAQLSLVAFAIVVGLSVNLYRLLRKAQAQDVAAGLKAVARV